MDATLSLPTPDVIQERIAACRDELAALKKLLRAAKAASAADEARRRRQAPRKGGSHA
jgi:hypothetical protein